MTISFRRFRKTLISTFLVLLILSALSRLVSASLATLPDDSSADAEPTSKELLCPPSEEVANLLRQIGARDAELEAREANIAMREQDIRIARQEIEAALQELRDAEETLAARMYQSDQASEQDVARLTEVYEGMKPKDAAVLFETMEANFAAGFLARMNADAASAIFSSLSAEKAYALSVVMAGRNATAATGSR